jgi:cell division protein FtsN
MAKSDEYREMQISSGQLATVILSLLALCILIFYLGIRVGTKRATDEAAEAALRAQGQTITPVKAIPSAPKPVAPSVSAADIATVVAETKIPPAETKTKPAETKSLEAKSTPAKPVETKPAQKTGTKSAPAKTKAAATPSGTYYIQAGAVPERPAAESLAQRIEGLGFRAIVLNPFANDKKTLYRVRVGPYETKETAESGRTKLAAALKKKAGDFFIVKG